MSSQRDDGKVVCKCHHKCGGLDGEGKFVAFSTRSLNRRVDAESITPTGSAFATFLASAASAAQQSPQSGSSNSGLHSLKRRIVPDVGHTTRRRRIDSGNVLEGANLAVRWVRNVRCEAYGLILVIKPPIEPFYLPPDMDGPELDGTEEMPVIPDINISLKFIAALQSAALNSSDEPLDPDLLHQIRNPATKILNVEDPDDRLSIDIFLAIGNGSEASYTSVRAAILRRNPEYKVLTYYKVKRLVSDLTGVVALERDMCINSCIGYTGPFLLLENCPYCGESRYEPGHAPEVKIPRRRFSTFPLAPQLQALWRTVDGANSMKYCTRCTSKIMEELAKNNGIRTSSDYLTAVQEGRISTDDMVLLYRNKVSEYHAPGVRYKKKYVLPGGIIGGPGKPKNSDSFIFPGLYHVAALQKEGLHVWDASLDRIFTSRPFVALGTADGPGMASINGLYCKLQGRRKPGGTHYYPARQEGCSHPDVKAAQRYQKNLQFIIDSPNKTQYEKRRLETGISKPTLFSGFPEKHILGVPGCFALDIMHLPSLNLPDLFIPLWRGLFECDKTDNKALWDWAVLKGDVWKEHGKMVANATPYIPGSFDRPPRNPAEKISSGYKAWEFLLYFYGLGPALLHGVLPDKYWKHYCKCVRGNRILMQEEITPAELRESNQKLTEFSDAFETLYCQRRTDRLHFVRPSIHTPSHMPFETARVGPGIIYSQWALERTIGNLGEEIKQHSNAFANLSQRALRRCQVNALKAMIPDLEPPENPLPRGSLDLGSGYVLLTAMDNAAREVDQFEATAIRSYLVAAGDPPPDAWTPLVTRWSRVRLPNGQLARSAWKEELKSIGQLRCARRVKISCGGRTRFAEVHFYLMFKVGGARKPLAVVSMFAEHHQQLYQDSSKTYVTMQHLGNSDIRVIDIKSIQSVVMLAPDEQYAKLYKDGSEVNRFYLMEKPGLKLMEMMGVLETVIPAE
ncbi:hypothetical protein B0H17DRAFT_1160683 [Mycena rosella]|uniref:Uncharacterized protein n=1 Tax=Mycena rosella TaxID=1033263 RepID=A0AAD7GF92_MYCRO|nr:hypothetical protein B0H17DRAFT_1160683 [Mycena rosella]